MNGRGIKNKGPLHVRREQHATDGLVYYVYFLGRMLLDWFLERCYFLRRQCHYCGSSVLFKEIM